MKKNSRVVSEVYETVKGLQRAGVVSAGTMREFDALCLPKAPVLKPQQIKKIREREHVSQPVFAMFLNVSPSTVKKWEAGDKYPNGAAIRLLALIKHYGLAIVCQSYVEQEG